MCGNAWVFDAGGGVWGPGPDGVSGLPGRRLPRAGELGAPTRADSRKLTREFDVFAALDTALRNLPPEDTG
ncbi:MAG: hypothetical protein ACREX8_03340 [Gammaproteobacteria bacterium]